jgi:hypothetical protein
LMDHNTTEPFVGCVTSLHEVVLRFFLLLTARWAHWLSLRIIVTAKNYRPLSFASLFHVWNVEKMAYKHT